ncbi:MAG: GntR family transcriptional regulator [Gemmatimonadetes bacterium]|nr:GntR family transcriptional regulator [Gemmatimonadota bacterium]
MLPLRIDSANGVPIYLQMIEQIRYQMARGVLKPHEELPSVRELAGQYLINPNTVVRAYLELERDGLIYKKRGLGTYVAERDVTISHKEKLEIVRELLDRALVQGVELKLTPEEMEQVIRERLARFRQQEEDD